MKKHLVAALLMIAACVVGGAAAMAAADTYPDRPVKIIVGFAAGRPDRSVRAADRAKASAQESGKNFFVENVPGAGGNVGAVRAAQVGAGRLHAAGHRRQSHQQSVSLQSRPATIR